MTLRGRWARKRGDTGQPRCAVRKERPPTWPSRGARDVSSSSQRHWDGLVRTTHTQRTDLRRRSSEPKQKEAGEVLNPEVLCREALRYPRAPTLAERRISTWLFDIPGRSRRENVFRAVRLGPSRGRFRAEARGKGRHAHLSAKADLKLLEHAVGPEAHRSETQR